MLVPTKELQRQWTGEEFTDAKMVRQMVCNKMWRFMANYDLLITPTLAVPAFPLYMQGPEIIEGRMVTSGDWLCFTFICNLTGQPAAYQVGDHRAGAVTGRVQAGLRVVGGQISFRFKADRLFVIGSAALPNVSVKASKQRLMNQRR